MTRRLISVLLGIAALASSTEARADILYQNAPDYPSGFDSVASQTDAVPGDPFFASFNSFQLSQDGLVDSITWQGAYVNADTSKNPPSPTATGFIILIEGSSGGKPDGVIVSDTFHSMGTGADQVQESFLANDPNFLLGFSTKTTAALYNYSLSLAIPIPLLGTTPLSLSVWAVTPNAVGGPYWGWNSGGSASGSGTYYTSDFGSYTLFSSRDRAFTLSGSAVPEPSSLAQAGLGIAAIGVGGLRARRRVIPVA